MNSVSFSPDGKTLAAGSDDNTARLWAVASGKELRTLTERSGAVNSVSFSPDGRFLATASEDSTTRLFDPESGTLLVSLRSDKDYDVGYVFTPAGYIDFLGADADKEQDYPAGDLVRWVGSRHCTAFVIGAWIGSRVPVSSREAGAIQALCPCEFSPEAWTASLCAADPSSNVGRIMHQPFIEFTRGPSSLRFVSFASNMSSSIQRVATRVKSGGHHVPDDVVRRRYAAGLLNFEIYKCLVDERYRIDTSTVTPRFVDHGFKPHGHTQ